MPTLLTQILPCASCGKLRHFYGATEDFTPDSDLCLECERAKDKRGWGRQQEMPA